MHTNMSSVKRRLLRNSPSVFTPLFSSIWPFCVVTPRRVSIPLMDVVKQRMEDLQVIRHVNTPTDWCAGMVVVAKPRVVSSTVEGEEKETHKVRIYVDPTKLNEIVMRENTTYHPSTKRLDGWREQRCS